MVQKTERLATLRHLNRPMAIPMDLPRPETYFGHLSVFGLETDGA